MVAILTRNLAYNLALVIVCATVAGLALAQAVPAERAQSAVRADPGSSTTAPPPRALTSSADNLEYYRSLVAAQAQVAHDAIESSQRSVDTIKDIIVLLSVGIGFLGAVLGFLGFKEYKYFRELRKDATSANEAAKAELARILAQEAEYQKWRVSIERDLKTQFDFFSARFQFEVYCNQVASPKGATNLGPPPEEARARLITQLEKIRQLTETPGDADRMFSWASAALAWLYEANGDYLLALSRGEESYKRNPEEFADRAYNCACYASCAYGVNHDSTMADTCTKWMRRALEQDPNCGSDALKDEDFKSVLELDSFKKLLAEFNQQASAKDRENGPKVSSLDPC
jgi:hypothetical protein